MSDPIVMLPTDRARGCFTYAWVPGPDGQPITFRRCKSDVSGRALLADAAIRDDLAAILPEGARGEMLRRYLAGRPTRLRAERASGLWTIEVTPNGAGFVIAVALEVRRGPAPTTEAWPDPKSVPPENDGDPASDPGAVLAALSPTVRPDRAMRASASLARRAGDGVLVLGSDGACRWASPAAAALLGRTDLLGEGWRVALTGAGPVTCAPGNRWTTATRAGRRVEVLIEGHDDEILAVLRDLGPMEDDEDEADTVSFVPDEDPVRPIGDSQAGTLQVGPPRHATPAGPGRSWGGSATPVPRPPGRYTPPAAPVLARGNALDDEVAKVADRRRRQGRPAALVAIEAIDPDPTARARLLAVASGVLRGADVVGDRGDGVIWAVLQDTTPTGAQRAITRLAEGFGADALWVGYATLDADDTVSSATGRAIRALAAAKRQGVGSVLGDHQRRVA